MKPNFIFYHFEAVSHSPQPKHLKFSFKKQSSTFSTPTSSNSSQRPIPRDTPESPLASRSSSGTVKRTHDQLEEDSEISNPDSQSSPTQSSTSISNPLTIRIPNQAGTRYSARSHSSQSSHSRSQTSATQ